MWGRNRYAILTVDTEALPNRANSDHVKRLMWGAHDLGQAGIREFASIGADFGLPHVFFVDLCCSYSSLDDVLSVIRWLDINGQDVQLHAHPEVLPLDYWVDSGFALDSQCMSRYGDINRLKFVISYFERLMSSVTMKRVNAFRAGSFRWGKATLIALSSIGIPLSFNNSMRAFNNKRCPFSMPTNSPYLWSNGVIEVPVTERYFPAIAGKPDRWVSLTYPESSYFRYTDHRGKLMDRLLGRQPDFTVFLLHSWSMLYWDENGHAVYKDDQRLEGYRKLLARISKDYDVITTSEFLDLHARGKIKTNQTVDIAQAEWPA